MTDLRSLTLAAFVGASALAATPVAADEIDARQARQLQRIEQGVRAGTLTRHEARGLIEEQKRIAELERRADRDGRVDRHERAEIAAAQDRASGRIFQEKHDSDNRPRHHWKRYGYWGHQGYWGRDGYWGRRWY